MSQYCLPLQPSQAATSSELPESLFGGASQHSASSMSENVVAASELLAPGDHKTDGPLGMALLKKLFSVKLWTLMHKNLEFS